MNDPILVQPLMPLARAKTGMWPEEAVEGLIEDLKAEGLDARLSHDPEPQRQEGGAPFDVIVLWVAEAAGEGAIGVVIGIAIEWARRQFRRYPEDSEPKFIEVVSYEGDEGRVVEVVQSISIRVPSADEEPVRIPPGRDFGRYTRKKPVEGPRRRRRG